MNPVKSYRTERSLRFTNVAAIALAVFLASANALEANLIVNGSFESAAAGLSDGAGRQSYVVGTHDTAISAWTLTGVGDVYLHESPDIGNAIGSNFNHAQSGTKYLDLSGGIGGGTSGNHATIYQEFLTTVGTTYELSFYIGAAFSPFATINVQVDGAAPILNQTLTAAPASTNINWTQHSFLFEADSNTSKLTFKDLSSFDDNVSFVDNVSVSAVPEPSSLVLLVGLGAAGLYRRVIHPLQRANQRPVRSPL
jgi:hypothetical protein